MDQDEYIAGITTSTHPDVYGKPAEEECNAILIQMYQSVLGAIAVANLTRTDIMVFASALQRVAHKPTHLHCKRLNAVVRWAQRNPKQLVYRRLSNEPNGNTSVCTATRPSRKTKTTVAACEEQSAYVAAEGNLKNSTWPPSAI
jgi:hypothetical protein